VQGTSRERVNTSKQEMQSKLSARLEGRSTAYWGPYFEKRAWISADAKPAQMWDARRSHAARTSR
jgi:hypothetical protein